MSTSTSSVPLHSFAHACLEQISELISQTQAFIKVGKLAPSFPPWKKGTICNTVLLWGALPSLYSWLLQPLLVWPVLITIIPRPSTYWSESSQKVRRQHEQWGRPASLTAFSAPALLFNGFLMVWFLNHHFTLWHFSLSCLPLPLTEIVLGVLLPCWQDLAPQLLSVYFNYLGGLPCTWLIIAEKQGFVSLESCRYYCREIVF